MPTAKSCVYEFGPFRADAERRLLTRNSVQVALTPKTFDILLLLLESTGRIVGKAEMMSALWPNSFVEEANISQQVFMLRKALGETAQDHQYIVTIPGVGYRFAAALKETHTQAAAELTKSASLPAVSPVQLQQTAPSWTLRYLTFALIAAVAAAALYAVRSHRNLHPQARPTLLTSPATSRRTLAVAGFQNLSGRLDEAWLSTAISEMLRTELAAGEKIRVIPEKEVARAQSEVSGKTPKAAEASRFSGSGSDYVVTGSYALIGQDKTLQIRVGARIQDAKTGEVVADIAETGPDSNLFELIARTGERLRERLGIEALSPTEVLNVRASLPSNPQAAQFYAAGLEKLRGFDALSAAQLLSTATRVEPSFPLAHSAMSAAWAALGYDARASVEARHAFDHSEHLSQEDKLRVEGRFRISVMEWDKAVSAYRSLWALHPDNLDDGLSLVAALTTASRDREALDTLAELRRLPSPAEQDPRVDLAEAQVYQTQGDFHRMPDALSRAAAKAEAQGATLLLAEARSRQCWVFRFIGRTQADFGACREALQIFTDAGNQGKAANTLRVFADALAESDSDRALGMYRQALRIQRRIGNVAGQALILNQLAIRAVVENDHSHAAAQFKAARKLFLKVDHKVAASGLLINIGGELVCQGQWKSAIKFFEQARDAGQRLGNKDLEGFALLNLGAVQQTRGNLVEAKQLFSGATALFKEVNDESQVGAAQFVLGQIATAEDDVALARKLHASALQIRQHAGEKLAAAQSEVEIADLSIKSGQPEDHAEQRLMQALQFFRKVKSINDQATGEVLLAQLLISQGRTAEGLQALQRARKSARLSDVYPKLAAMIEIFRLEGTLASRTERQPIAANLNLFISRARTHGFSGLELEGRLALGELQIVSGDRNTAYATLESVAKDARSRGLQLISKRASEKLTTVSLRAQS